jgi:DNA-binding response OmpR family regulator
LSKLVSKRYSLNTVSPAPVILLVEDECIIRTALAGELMAAGWTVLEVSTGEAATALFRDEPRIDALVTDIHLAGYLSGWEVAEFTRGVRPDVPVIYMSGKAVEKSRMVPGGVFLSKPCSPVDVLAAARAVMQFNRRTA